MDPKFEFWMNWAVEALAATATFGAVVVALFGSALQQRLFRPKLRLALIASEGNKTDAILITTGATPREEPARYYHVRLVNESKWSTATQAQVYLVRIETPGIDGSPIVRWSGDIPIKWRWHEIHPLQRTIGPPADCDLCSVVRNTCLQLHPIVVPTALRSLVIQPVGKSVDLTMVLQARAAEGESPMTPFRIRWDGKWEDGDTEMKNHLMVSDVTPLAFDAVVHY